MADPTNFRPRHFEPRTGRDVWASTSPLGYSESIRAAGTVAAPLLAGASFTLVALVLQSGTPFGRWPNLALLSFVAAGLAQVFAVQSVIWTRRYLVTPDELRQWFPEDFTDHGERPTPWVQQFQRWNLRSARRWAARTRAWINAGITLLLAGIAVGVTPSGDISPVRWSVITVAWTGVAVEASWVATMRADERARADLLLRSAAVLAAGGASVAAGFAVVAGPADGPATWWAVALALTAAPCWLAACTGARLRYGRLRLHPSRNGGWLILQAVLAPVAPAVFVLALVSALASLARGRREALREQHPGTSNLLPSGVSLGAYHRAWNRCSAWPVTTRDELAGLLAEPSQQPSAGDQPELAALWAAVVRSPGCVVRVTDRDDERARLGYYVVYPLLAASVGALRSGQLTEPGPADLATSPGPAAGWYIAVIRAPGRRWTRRCVIATLVDALAAAGAGSPDQPVFGIPLTSLVERNFALSLSTLRSLLAIDRSPF
jgi:hypothetical protein